MPNLLELNLPDSWDYVTLTGAADTHRACETFDLKRWTMFLNWLKTDERAYTFLLGDLAHTATKESKSDSYKATMTLKQELDCLEAELAPVKHKIIGVCRGNHEKRTERLDSRDPMRDLCKFLGIADRYQPSAVHAKVTFGKKANNKRQCVTVYGQHGFGGGATKGAPANMLAKMAVICPVADLYMAGHCHQPIVFRDSYKTFDLYNNKCVRKERTYVGTASFSDYEDWLEEIGRPPSAFVVPKVTITEEKCISVQFG